MTPSQPELLAPAGDWDCLRAAVTAGADAVYFGLPAFNARLRAENFTERDLPEVMDYLHVRGRRGYLTMNVLIFPSELAEAERLLRLASSAKVDALIVQDLGLVRLAKAVCPDLELHASTQMTLT
ncbi:MAG: U32 family peptidase, partial [Verrucomicrobia bacterium]|nr:U32 family peptidase [Verrucomicrobiota bacterium]